MRHDSERNDGEPPVILLTDDDAAFRSAFTRGLRRYGWTVLEAEDVSRAMELLDTHRIDVVVVDIVLPDGFGSSLALSARQQHPDVGVIFVSGYTEEDPILKQGIQEHMVFLPKPFTLEELAGKIEEALERQEVDRRARDGSEDADPEE